MHMNLQGLWSAVQNTSMERSWLLTPPPQPAEDLVAAVGYCGRDYTDWLPTQERVNSTDWFGWVIKKNKRI